MAKTNPPLISVVAHRALAAWLRSPARELAAGHLPGEALALSGMRLLSGPGCARARWTGLERAAGGGERGCSAHTWRWRWGGWYGAQLRVDAQLGRWRSDPADGAGGGVLRREWGLEGKFAFGQPGSRARLRDAARGGAPARSKERDVAFSFWRRLPLRASARHGAGERAGARLCAQGSARRQPRGLRRPS